MRYCLYLFFACASSLYGAQQNLPTILALATINQQTPCAFSIDSCTCMSLPSEHCIRTAGGSMIAASILVSVFFGYPIPYPSNIFICSVACPGACLLGSSKILANRKCTLWYCYPNVCKGPVAQHQLPEVPTVPELISVDDIREYLPETPVSELIVEDPASSLENE